MIQSLSVNTFGIRGSLTSHRRTPPSCFHPLSPSRLAGPASHTRPNHGTPPVPSISHTHVRSTTATIHSRRILGKTAAAQPHNSNSNSNITETVGRTGSQPLPISTSLATFTLLDKGSGSQEGRRGRGRHPSGPPPSPRSSAKTALGLHVYGDSRSPHRYVL